MIHHAYTNYALPLEVEMLERLQKRLRLLELQKKLEMLNVRKGKVAHEEKPMASVRGI